MSLKIFSNILFSPKSLLTKSSQCGIYEQLLYRSRMNDARKPPIDIDNLQTMQDIKLKLFNIMGITGKYENEDRSWLSKYLPTTQSELPPRSMNDSYDRAIVPLSTDLTLQNKYTTTHKGLRMGRLLEDMDHFAVWIVMKHIYNPKQPVDIPTPYVVVTLLVDDVIINPIRFPDKDLILSGQVTHAGKTSLEVTLWLDQINGDKYERITRAHFVFVARDPTNTSSVIVNTLVPSGEREEQILFRSAKKNEDRKRARQNSILNRMPTSEEQSLIYETFMKTVDQNEPIIGNKVLPINSVWMDDTKIETNILCHPEDRNLHYTVFGGYLMRVATELAFLVASIHSKTRVVSQAINSITFRKPVPIGSRLKLIGKICYTSGRIMIVEVIAKVEEIESKKSLTSNSFYHVFVAPKDVDAVLPQGYHDSMLYIDGRRRYCEFVNHLTPEDN
ncbi:HotDog domain,Hotdog acyl-CoA thioesterase (ACOT)-type domain,Thioesterase domain [Cinara cedri]|uniref:HotDog domain,Hotdog acyl-CoA thioesterase (ACOT)-type domain,Thioesterase domain n=1 Tax=Cinara cedri TaxID=506608 RepID=A0A5E4M776_9HEMI|nr:HotDog domain,Hotdog acyl-CoA thioesterase (ACOT)-type domain,Thioesterase domain [Cinara cedri]